ncbi:hypothetical protein JAAARDRAFT_59093 [Jaapia argillacea MUCL 33604]|uniref:Uncharacterized protein n=1 Tax=Jaapia argillacea MUCL 33604 TaxID=933084 RepID=A0A067PPY5_9AGAM|nr:hypothetical protein JAAARDRAFT_59093 [Jaapia argillacea MUCL 33604]
MAARSPTQRIRSKTSDLSDFLRGGSRHAHDQLAPPVPQVPAEAENSQKGRRRLLFLGRRKKTEASPPSPTPSPTSQVRFSEHQQAASSQSTLQGPEAPPKLPEKGYRTSVQGDAGPSKPRLSSTLPPLNVSPPSLGPLFSSASPTRANVAFPSNPPTSLPRPKATHRPTGSNSNSRSASFDSTLSKDRTRSPTPRASGIAISVSPPRNNAASSSNPGNDKKFSSVPRSVAPSPVPRPQHRRILSVKTRVPEPEKLEVPSSAPPSSPSRFAEEQSRAIPRSSNSDAEDRSSKKSKEIPRASTSSVRSRSGSHQRSGVSYLPSPLAKTKSAPSAPPNIPLPAPPTRNSLSDSGLSSQSSVPTIPSMSSISSRSSMMAYAYPSPRPRVLTTSSMPIRHTSSSDSERYAVTTPSKSSIASGRSPLKHEYEVASESETDTETQLRERLRDQTVKVDQLSEYLLEVLSRHEGEKGILERRIEQLEKEARKRDKEIRGLRYLIMNGGLMDALPGASLQASSSDLFRTLSRSPGSSAAEGLNLLQDSSPSSSRPGTAPSHVEPESPSAPKPSRHRTLKRSITLPENHFAQTTLTANRSQGSISRSPTISITESTDSLTNARSLGLDLPTMTNQPSMSSLSSFSSTSTSSLPALTTTSTATSALSAIPESPSPYTDTSSKDAAKQREKEERRHSRILKRLSASSTTSLIPPSPVVHTSHSDSKKGKGKSIEQVLDQTSDMEELLEKLRRLGP